MARSRQEVINFLNSKVGTTVPDKVNSNLNGQCVTLIKATLEFLGVPSPYAARGNAKDYDDKILQQGIATNGKGWLNIVVNPTMGVVGSNVYGHIWVDADGTNWEQNGAKALTVTKNTRPAVQGRQWVNLDKWIAQDKPKEEVMDIGGVNALYEMLLGRPAYDFANKKWLDDGASYRVGQPWDKMFYEVKDSDEARKYRDKVAKALQGGSDQYEKVEVYRKVA